MPYKAFFVEDEIVTREGIRDKVDWQGNGFEFCGEAPDGEMALPLLQVVQPDVLITDIKMPFMDGLELCKIVREQMPWVKIIILSGHDEFEYAQQAINLGVTEYLLKPVTVQDLHRALHRIATQIDRERRDRENLDKLRSQVEENRAALRERLLLNLVVGTVSSAEAIEKGHLLGLDLVAGCYLVIAIRIGLRRTPGAFDYHEYQRTQQALAEPLEQQPDVWLIKKDVEELVLILKGSAPEHLHGRRELLLQTIQQQAQAAGCEVTIGCGTAKQRITDIYQSFVEAVVEAQSSGNRDTAPLSSSVVKAELLKINKAAVESYLRCGVKEDFPDFFDTFIRPLCEAALKSYMVKNYIVMDIVLAAAKFVTDLGGNVDQIVPALDAMEKTLAAIETVEQFREQVQEILVGTLTYRDRRANNQHSLMLQQVHDYIDQHYVDANLSLNEVASQVNLSPSHFSTVFSQETGQTFKEYLTEVRIKRAKELLRSTTLKSFEISYQIGYSDPHYFSYVFRKHTGQSPKEYRLQTQPG
ncbi:putative response regulatory protein [Thermoflexales bacterium]|nr:putative response regulatory protein [Thermoflexales bacterium]